MSKSMYSENTIWYDPVIMKSIEELAKKHSNAIPVFGCALYAYEYSMTDFDRFVSYIPHLIHDAEFFGWHEGVIGAIHRFCHICFVDPALVEAYIGMSFMQLLEV